MSISSPFFFVKKIERKFKYFNTHQTVQSQGRPPKSEGTSRGRYLIKKAVLKLLLSITAGSHQIKEAVMGKGRIVQTHRTSENMGAYV